MVPADALPDPLLLVTPEGLILMANEAAREELGADRHGDLAALLAEGGADELRDYLLRCAGEDAPLPGALTLRDAAGSPREYRCDGWRQSVDDGPAALCLRLRPSPVATRSVRALSDTVERLGHEVAVRQRAEDRLRHLLHDKEVLIRELHHRIRNTLQVLASLCNLQARVLPEGDARRPLLRQVRHITAVGAVMRTLYREGDMAEVDVRAFAENMCASQAAARGVETRVRFEVRRLDLDTATPFALAFDELLTEVLEGMPQEGGGGIEISLRRAGGGLELVLDHGGAARLRQGASARERILGMLVRQLEGSLERGAAATRLVFAEPGHTHHAAE